MNDKFFYYNIKLGEQNEMNFNLIQHWFLCWILTRLRAFKFPINCAYVNTDWIILDIVLCDDFQFKESNKIRGPESKIKI